MTRSAAIAFTAGLTLLACSAVLGIPGDPHLCGVGECPGLNADAGAGEPVPSGDGGPLDCLDNVSPLPDKGDITFTARFTDVITAEVLPGVVARACPKFDLNCTTPLITLAPSDQNGLASTVIADSFDGYFKTTKAGALDGLNYAGPPLHPRAVIGSGIFTTEQLKSLAGVLDVEPSPELGSIFVQVFDCSLATTVAGVSLRLDIVDKSTRTEYLIGGTPSATATETDSSGYGGFINVPVGTVTVTGALTSANRKYGSRAVIVRPNAVTLLALGPARK